MIRKPDTCMIGCLLLAAGYSSRFHGNKLTAELQGKMLIEYPLSLIRQLEKSDPQIEAAAVAAAPEIVGVCRDYRVRCILYEGGLQSDSIRVGLDQLQTEQWAGCMFLTGDQPMVSQKSLQHLIQDFRADPLHIYRLSWRGQPGNPVIFPAEYFPDLRSLTGDTGGRQIIQNKKAAVRLTEAEDALELTDIDTEKDLKDLKEQLKRRTP
ncbi:MAG: nucleotidyltransferase family protein [Lachnospiraceae bacterium]|nr:nucleotidyltransferase family protein [Lachnospiraceae bacterium]MCI1657617.1 nucleotidyltransferase family protein [Lachnospiraceae bacterium]MCI2196032.1 nucleotidyltransferase family protein [Lachnospiraceae bacterium]